MDLSRGEYKHCDINTKDEVVKSGDRESETKTERSRSELAWESSAVSEEMILLARASPCWSTCRSSLLVARLSDSSREAFRVDTSSALAAASSQFCCCKSSLSAMCTLCSSSSFLETCSESPHFCSTCERNRKTTCYHLRIAGAPWSLNAVNTVEYGESNIDLERKVVV